METALQRIENKLDALEARLESQQSDLAWIKEKFTSLEKSASKLDSHVDFVETVYEHVRHPINFLLRRTSGYQHLSERKAIEES